MADQQEVSQHEDGNGDAAEQAGRGPMDSEILALNRLFKTFGAMDVEQRVRTLYMLNARFAPAPPAPPAPKIRLTRLSGLEDLLTAAAVAAGLTGLCDDPGCDVCKAAKKPEAAGG